MHTHLMYITKTDYPRVLKFNIANIHYNEDHNGFMFSLTYKIGRLNVHTILMLDDHLERYVGHYISLKFVSQSIYL